MASLASYPTQQGQRYWQYGRFNKTLGQEVFFNEPNQVELAAGGGSDSRVLTFKVDTHRYAFMDFDFTTDVIGPPGNNDRGMVNTFVVLHVGPHTVGSYTLSGVKGDPLCYQSVVDRAIPIPTDQHELSVTVSQTNANVGAVRLRVYGRLHFYEQ